MTSFCTCEDISITKTITWGSNFTSSYCGWNLVYKEEKRKQKKCQSYTLSPPNVGTKCHRVCWISSCHYHFSPSVCSAHHLNHKMLHKATWGAWNLKSACENCVCCFCIKCWLVFNQIPESDCKGKCQFFLETLRQTSILGTRYATGDTMNDFTPISRCLVRWLMLIATLAGSCTP